MVQNNSNMLLTSKEVCEQLRITNPTLIKLRKQGKIETVIYSGKVFFLPQSIDNFINEQRTKIILPSLRN